MHSSRWMLTMAGIGAMTLAAALPAYGGAVSDAQEGSSFLAATNFKVGASGQIYSWKAACCGNPGTWSTVVHGRAYSWRAGYEASTADVMHGMGLRRDMLVREHAHGTYHVARR